MKAVRYEQRVIIKEQKQEHHRALAVIHKQAREVNRHNVEVQKNSNSSKFKTKELQLSVTQLYCEIIKYKIKIDLSNKTDRRKKRSNRIEILKQNLSKWRLEATKNEMLLVLSLNRVIDAETKNKDAIKEMNLAR